MKAAIISLNKRIILKERNIRALEAINIRQWLLSINRFEQVDYVSTKTRDASEDVEFYKDASETPLNDYDSVFVHNDTENFMGGVLSRHTIKQIKELCSFQGSVYYFYTDPNLHLKNLAKVIYDRQVRGTKTAFNTELRISQDDVRVFSNLKWKVIWCGKDFEKYRRDHYQKIPTELKCHIENHKSLEFFQFVFKQRLVELPRLALSSRAVDLVYYGNWRPKRAQKITQYLTNDLRKSIIGFDRRKLSVSNADYQDYISPDKLPSAVQQAVASIVIGDDAHNNNITTARFYENILFDVCSFIDLDYDPSKCLYQSSFLKDFMYVRSGRDLVAKINQVKADQNLFERILSEQKAELSS
jgi:hypothetical protein